MALNNLSYNLAAIRRACCLRRLLSAAGLALLLPGLFCCILNAWEFCFSLQESAAALGMAFGGFLFLMVLGIVCHFRIGRALAAPLTELAKVVEKRCPDFQDAYFAAVELEGRNRPLRPMEEMLLQRMRQQHGGKTDFLRRAFAGELSWRKPLVLLALALLAWGAAAGTGNVLTKAQCAWRPGTESGLHFHELLKEYPVHSDVRIGVDILRWEKKAWIEMEDRQGGRRRLPMTNSISGTSAFTFYDLSEEVSFRICTPSLRSSWRKIRVYVPPAAGGIRLTAAPPAYTRRNSRSWTALQDLEAIAGSMLILQLEAPEDVSVSLTGNGVRNEAPGSARTFRTLLDQDTEFVLSLRDAAGHSVSYPPFKVSVTPDLPPVVELREPEPDAKVRRGDSVRLALFAGDDFGVARIRLRFSVSGSRKQEIELFRAEKGRENPEEEVLWRWDLPKYQVKDGDLLSCFIEVADNRTPEPQWTRSDLFFLTVRPHEDLLEEEQQKGRDSGQKFDISDLIAENKRLLRLSLDSLGAELKDRRRNQFELHRNLTELSLEVVRRMNRLVEMSQGRPQPGLPELFRFSSEELKQAARLVEKMLFEESLQPEERSLTALIRIENELIKNSMRRKQDGKQKEPGSQQEQQNPRKQEERQQTGENLQLMKKMLENLRNIADRQRKYNDRCRKNEDLPEKLAREQNRIQEQTARLEEDMKSVPQAKRSAGHLKQAGQEMHQGAQAMADGRAAAGEIHGVRAHRNLEQALRSLESAVRGESAGMVEQLAETAGKLADRQRREAQRSGQMAGKQNAAEARDMRTRQKQLSAMTGALKQEIQKMASLLEKDFPEAAADMRRRAEESTRRGLEKAQKRAENGLLYRRFQTAGKSQQEAANLLQALSQGLHESAGKMPPVSADELRDALERLQRSADRIAGELSDSRGGQSARRIQEQRQASGEMLQRLGESLRDRGLMELSDMLKLSDGSSSPDQAGSRGLELLKASADILIRHLRTMEQDEKLRLNRSQLLPPEKYRRQVQEYFKSLGEEK